MSILCKSWGIAGDTGPEWDVDLDHSYVMDVIEEMGNDVAHRCYWDFGRWSDLCRVWRPTGNDRSPEEAVDIEVIAFVTVNLSCCHLSCVALLLVHWPLLRPMPFSAPCWQ